LIIAYEEALEEALGGLKKRSRIRRVASPNVTTGFASSLWTKTMNIIAPKTVEIETS
jgi:hypothetical protein